MENIQLILIGNSYKAKTRSFVGVEDEELITKYNIGKAFMAATGVSISNGLTNSDLLEYRIKKMIVEKASDVYLLADGSKFNKSTLLTYAPLEKVDTIITTPNIPAEYQIFCQEQGINLLTTT